MEEEERPLRQPSLGKGVSESQQRRSPQEEELVQLPLPHLPGWEPSERVPSYLALVPLQMGSVEGQVEGADAVEETNEAAALLFATPSSGDGTAHWEDEVVLPSAPPGLTRRTRSMTPPLRRRSRKEQAVIYR